MNKNVLIKLITLAIAGMFHSAEANTVNIKFPNNSNVYTTSVGSFFDANIYVDSFADLGGFDLWLTYNSDNLAAQSLTSNTIFGADTDANFANSIAPNSIHFAEAIAFDSPATAGLNVTGPTLLGTVKFKALTVSPINAAYLISFSSASGFYTFDGTPQGATAQGGNVRVTVAPAAVPLPASVFLFAPALLALFGVQNKNRKMLLA
ncbi:hypothetical protein [Methylomonas fluvii]|uniref:Cohesin domain-containing protein n=1 Tax=Methylomonas fluvii TaxID=1854564 RepID=A0ABR9DHC0_9GAMM|nr:hypothetical protein [Methylomonas fluvii]MBD9362505.1 hypothetical protein [Methylomonas fluvii]